MSWLHGETQYHNLINSGETFLVYFTDPKCGPCFRVKSQLKRFQKDTNIPIVEINYREEYDLYVEYKLPGTPAVMLFREKELLNTWMGYKSHGQWKYVVDEELNPKEKVDPRLT